MLVAESTGGIQSPPEKVTQMQIQEWVTPWQRAVAPPFLTPAIMTGGGGIRTHE
jgi:hypothetical protein